MPSMRIFLLIVFAVPFMASAAESVALPNFRQVTEGVFRGGRPTAEGLTILKKEFGVKTVINLQGGDVELEDPAAVDFMRWWEPGETAENIAKEREIVESQLGLRFISAPLISIRPVSKEEDRLINYVLEVMHDPAAQPVYVHCEHGFDRTGLVIALYEVKYLNYTITSAHKEWADSGHKGLGKLFTGRLDTYFYDKAAKLKASGNSFGRRLVVSSHQTGGDADRGQN